MRKLLFSLMALTLFGVSCQQNDDIRDVNNGDVVEVNIGVGIPELATRSGETDMNSGLGAIDNFSDDDWANYDIRYILEVYDVSDGYANLDEPIKKREVKAYDAYQETMFSVRLIPQRDYRFVVWADFVAEGSAEATDMLAIADLHYNTADLNAIERLTSATAMDECQDAYFIQQDLHIGASGIEENLVLKRPFGKIRVIATDYNEVNIGSEPERVEVRFYNHKLLTTLNAVTGVAEGETLNEYIYTVAKDAPYTQGYDEADENMTLFADYILAADETVGAQEINFTIDVFGKDGRIINSHDFNTQVPLERNHLTTIVGNLLTLQNDITISVDDDFDGEYIRNWDDEAVTLVAWGAGELNENGNYEFELNDGVNNFTLILPEGAVNQTTGKISPVGKAEFVASEAELAANTFTIEGLMIEPTRAAEEAIVTLGTMRVSNWNDGVHVQFDLWYTFDAEADPAEYKNIRFEFKGDALAKTTLATPVVAASAVENVITLTWAAVEGAGSYAITNGTEMPVFTEECEYTFTGEFATEYTLKVVAIPADEEKNYASEAAEVTIAIGAELLATPAVKAEPKENTVVLTWDAIEGAGSYSITVGTEMPVFTEELSYTFTGEYETEYTFTVTAVPADEVRYKVSNPATATATTEAEPLDVVAVAFNKMTAGGYNGSYWFYSFELANDNGDSATLYVSDYVAVENLVKDCTEWPNYVQQPLTYYANASDAGNGFNIANLTVDGVNYGKPTNVEASGLVCEDGVITITAAYEDTVITVTIDQNNLVKPKVERTVTVQVTDGIDEMYFYSWNDAGTITANWPGDKMTNAGGGKFTYTYAADYDGQTVNFIFNDGKGTQTDDITNVTLDTDVEYNYSDMFKPTIYSLIGDFNDWGADVDLVDGGDGWYRAESVELEGEFLIRLNHAWDEKYGDGNIVEGDNTLRYGGSNMTIAAGTYNFAFNPTTAILNVEKVQPAAEAKAVNLTFFTDNGTSFIFKGDDGHNYLLAFRDYNPGTFSLTDNAKFIASSCTWTASNTTYFGGTQFAEGDTLELIKNGSGWTATYTIIIRAKVDGVDVVATCASTNFQ